MAYNAKRWLWNMLDHDCGIEEGRVAYWKERNALLSSYKVFVSNSSNVLICQVVNEKGKVLVIRTMTSGVSVIPPSPDDDNFDVLEICEHRLVGNIHESGLHYEYKVLWRDGSKTWEGESSFVETCTSRT